MASSGQCVEADLVERHDIHCNLSIAHINNLYNTTFWALVLKGKMSTTDAHNALKVRFLFLLDGDTLP
jgi:tRNA(His) 5'-end guanylyltransferase